MFNLFVTVWAWFGQWGLFFCHCKQTDCVKGSRAVVGSCGVAESNCRTIAEKSCWGQVGARTHACSPWGIQLPTLRKSLSMHELRLSGAQPFYSMQIFKDEKGMVQTAEQPPGHFETCASQTSVPSLVPLLAICLHGISTPFMGCRLHTHACKFPAKSLCVVPSEECPDQSDWDITHLTLCFWLCPILVAPQAFLISLPPQGSSTLLPSSIWPAGGNDALGPWGKDWVWMGSADRGVSLVGRGAGEARGSLPWMCRALSSLL